MTIREATHVDVPQLVEMGRAFRLGLYADAVAENVEQMAETARLLIDGEDSVIYVAEGRGGGLLGMIGLRLFVHPISGELTVGEVFLWGEGAGMRLLYAAKKWARAHGATKLQMIQPINETRVGDLYHAMGYRCIEAAWQLDLEAA